MRSNPTNNLTLQRIQQEINEIAQRENELRSNGNGTIQINGDNNINNDTMREIPSLNGTNSRRFVSNTNTRGVMQKFFKLRGKISTVSTISRSQSTEVQLMNPAKSLIPPDKPLRKGYVPVEERIQKELHEMRSREDELRKLRRKSQPDLMKIIENDDDTSTRSPSPTPIAKLRTSRSLMHLLDDDISFDNGNGGLRPAKSLAELCHASECEIESPRVLIQKWESIIQNSL